MFSVALMRIPLFRYMKPCLLYVSEKLAASMYRMV
jgi:hypothetical protein